MRGGLGGDVESGVGRTGRHDLDGRRRAAHGKPVRWTSHQHAQAGVAGHAACRSNRENGRSGGAAHGGTVYKRTGPPAPAPPLTPKTQATMAQVAWISGVLDWAAVDGHPDDRRALDAVRRRLDARGLPNAPRRPHVRVRIPLHRRTRQRARLHGHAERPDAGDRLHPHEDRRFSARSRTPRTTFRRYPLHEAAGRVARGGISAEGGQKARDVFVLQTEGAANVGVASARIAECWGRTRE